MNKEMNTVQQILDFLENKKRLLLMGHARIDADALGSVLAMYRVFKELGKEVTAVCSDPIPEVFKFLPTTNVLRNTFGANDFVITLDCSKTPLEKLKYNLEDNKVNIILTPKSGHFAQENVSFSYGSKIDFEAIITFDCGDLQQLGKLYEDNVELFYEKPLINIDHHASNVHFGTLNLVNPVAASTTEMLYDFILALEARTGKKLLTPDVATLLLAGLITDTGSFQHANTSPKAMETAAKLLDEGARQQEIIRHIYKTKSLSTLKLWGIVLSKIQVDPVYRMVWSTVSKDDLKEAEAQSDESSGIIDDLMSNAPGAEVVFLIREDESGMIATSLRTTTPQVDGSEIAGLFGGGGHVRAAGFKIRDGRRLEEVAAEIIEKIRQYQAKRLNIHIENGLIVPHGAEKLAATEKKPASVKDKSEISPVKTGPVKVTYLDFKGSSDALPPKEKTVSAQSAALTSKKPAAAEPEPSKATAAMPSLKKGPEVADEATAQPVKRKRKRRRGKRGSGTAATGTMPATESAPTVTAKEVSAKIPVSPSAAYAAPQPGPSQNKGDMPVKNETPVTSAPAVPATKEPPTPLPAVSSLAPATVAMPDWLQTKDQPAPSPIKSVTSEAATGVPTAPTPQPVIPPVSPSPGPAPAVGPVLPSASPQPAAAPQQPQPSSGPAPTPAKASEPAIPDWLKQ